MRQLNIRTKSRLGYAFLAAITLILTILGVIGAKLYLLVAAIAVYLLAGLFFIQWITGKIHWYEGILDSIPFPLSITDAQRRWTFINKPVEDMLGVKRADMLGKQCDNWGAGICNTDNCGINCLKRGKTSTTFEQGGMDFKVDVSYLTNPKGHVIGHIEVVQDISRIVKTQKAEAEIVVSIARVSDSFVSGTGRIADGAAILASGSAQQTATIEELSNSVTELTEQTKRNAEMAEKAARLAGTIKHNAEKGSRQMGEMISAVKDIDQSSNDISKVIKLIDDISFQTNILALNASVEAARAGQHGRGFSIVAEEVRNLAARSAEAARDTGSMIAKSMEKARVGVRIAEETSSSLSDIVSGINESNRLINEIASASESQAVGITQISAGIYQVSAVVQQNNATAEESAAAAAEMNAQARSLDELTTKFQAVKE